MATNFEGYTHEQLLAMIASIDPETVKTRATQLADAATVIKEIGGSLKKHQVKGWEGEAAQKFQEWVSRAGSATLRLGDYSADGGKWMTEAAQTMVEVKANTPKYDTTAASNLEAAKKYHNDPDAQKVGQTAHSKLTADHQAAVQQLTKLAQSYEASTTQLNKAEIPTFPPPPGVFAPLGVGNEELSRSRPGDGSSGSSGAGGAGRISASTGGGVPTGGSDWAPGPPASPDVELPATGSPLSPSTQIIPGRDVEVDLDHVATLPDKVLPPTTGTPVVGPVGPGGGNVNPVGPVPPLTLPPTTGLKVPGIGSLPSTRPPSGLGGSKVVGLPPRDTGIVGGRQISPGGPSTGIPRGRSSVGKGRTPSAVAWAARWEAGSVARTGRRVVRRSDVGWPWSRAASSAVGSPVRVVGRSRVDNPSLRAVLDSYATAVQWAMLAQGLTPRVSGMGARGANAPTIWPRTKRPGRATVVLCRQ